jgi:hypothetical protein
VAYRALTSHPAAVERRAHELLAFQRVDPRRGFFTVTPAQAVTAVQQASIEVAGIQAWDTEEPVMLRAGDRVALTLRAGQWLVVLPHRQGSVPSEPIDIWQAHSDGDLLELMAAKSAGPVAGLSNNDEDGTATRCLTSIGQGDVPNWPIIGRERLEPGQRLLWLDGAIDPPGARSRCLSSIAPVRWSAGREPPCSVPRGSLLLNVVTEEPTETMVEVIRGALRMPPTLTAQPSEPLDEPENGGDRSVARTTGFHNSMRKYASHDVRATPDLTATDPTARRADSKSSGAESSMRAGSVGGIILPAPYVRTCRCVCGERRA